MEHPSKTFLSKFFSAVLLVLYFSSGVKMGARDILSMIAPQQSLLSFCSKLMALTNSCDVIYLKISEYNLHVHTKTLSSITRRIPLKAIICVSVFSIGLMVIKYDTYLYFYVSHIFVLRPSRGTLSIQSIFVIIFPILGASLIIVS